MPRSRFFSRTLPLLLAPLAACQLFGDRPAGADLPPAAVQAWRGSVHVTEGAQGVRNPATPLLPEGSVRVDTAWRLAESAAWTKPVALTLSERDVFVLDPAAARIHVASHDGEAREDLGDGAGLSEPVSIAWSGGTLAVGDKGRGAIVRLRDDGLPLEPLRGLDRAAVQGLASGGFIANSYAGRTHQWRLYAANGGGERMLELPRPPGSAAGEYCASVSAGRWILQAGCVESAFQVLDENGKLVRQVSLERPVAAAPVASDSVSAVLQKQLASGATLPDTTVRRLLESGEPLRVTRGARHDPASKLFALWGQLPGGGAWVDLFSEEGVYLATVRFARPWTDVGFARSTLFALEPGEDGKATLAAYRLRLPSNALKAARDAARGSGADSSGG